MNNEPEANFMSLTVMGEDRPGLLERLAARIADSGCNIEECRMAALGGRVIMIILLSGLWHALSRLEAQLPALASQLDLGIEFGRVNIEQLQRPALPYSVEVSTGNRPGVIRALAAFFARQGINIEEMQATSYAAPHTGAAMSSVVMTVSLPAKVHIATLRADFFDYCDELNLDATFEPVRG